MNENRRPISKREFLKLFSLAASANLLAACAEPQRPSATPKPASVPDVSKPTAVSKTIPLPTNPAPEQPGFIVPKPAEKSSTPAISSELLQSDSRTKLTLEQAKQGEKVDVNKPLVEYVFRFPWEGNSAIIALLDTVEADQQQQQKEKTAAVLLSADCIYDAFQQNNDLGRAITPGAWRPRKRLDKLTANVSVPSEIGVPKPVLNVREIRYKSVDQQCKETTASERLKDFVSKINWDDIPKDTGRFIGWFASKLAEGLRSGLSTPTPTH
ncbi:MAG: hypothetical protein A2857_02760 [Candidatus Levybacteria bacterium RIFCSPHIGHO2_01_FULL_36_15]|nr:MAG: hypothetical protein A2857_02760 [Candidatus Levybacteria bacterium RIFCSPHIGHO2_01_FULL_36_15]OGH38662.1 MAG: hypothetical protein A2905_02180 [Candidatus Levybacteria bacterium RIFCSPLOWO2_01_FULL_36_10]